MKSLELYLDHIEGVCGGAQAEYHKITEIGEKPPITVASFKNVPEPGCLTAFSFGLSSVDHVEWKSCRPELMISVDSLDTSWALAMGELVRNGRHKCLFSYGTILNFENKITDESEITSFLVFASNVLNSKDLTVILPDRKVFLSQIYPIHNSEKSVIKEVGPEKFVFDLGVNFFDVNRSPFA